MRRASVEGARSLSLLLTVQQCAELTSESIWTWRFRAYRGVVDSVKLTPRGRLLIPREEVDRLISAGLRRRQSKQREL
jgi:hypothetical protein